MHIHSGYWGKPHEIIEDPHTPLLVTAAGCSTAGPSEKEETHRPHGRPDYQLLYLAEGTGTLHLHGKKQTLSAGTAVLFRPGEPQRYTFHAKDKPTLYWVHFTGGDAAPLTQTFEAVFFAGSDPEFPRIFRRMIAELQLRRTHSKELLELDLRRLLLMLDRATGTALQGDLRQAIRYFNENYHLPIVIEDYAREHLLSANWFTQCFTRLTGQTPLQYLISLRLSNAMHLLESTGASVTRIAAAVGYENPLYFSRLFKKHLGLTPTEYRQGKHCISPKTVVK